MIKGQGRHRDIDILFRLVSMSKNFIIHNKNMSRKYFDKLMTGTGVTDKKFKSTLGERLMKGMGWAE